MGACCEAHSSAAAIVGVAKAATTVEAKSITTVSAATTIVGVERERET
jgi:hypothetical protein